jgi:oleandomycin transport system permease protein
MTAVVAPAFPAPARRLGLRVGLRNTFTLTWRSVLKIRTNMEDLLGLLLQPIMYLLLFTYVFGGALAGAVLGDMIRYMTSVAVTLGFGMILGFRITASPLSAAAGCLLVLAFALAMCWFSALIGLMVKSAQGVQWFGFLVMFPLVFGSNLLVQTATMPGWLQAFVKVNPMTYLTEAERGLLTGGPAATPALRSLLWALGIFIVFAPLAVRVYRRKT